MVWRLSPKSLQNHNRFCKIQGDGFYPKSKHNQSSTTHLCDNCKQNYGSCSLFVTHDLVMEQLKGATLCSSNLQEAVELIDDSLTELMYLNSVCAMATHSISQDLVWFLKIDEIMELTTNSVDGYGHHIAAGFRVIKGRYLEQASEKSNIRNYLIIMKNVMCLKRVLCNHLWTLILKKYLTSSEIMITVGFFPFPSTLECLQCKKTLHILIFSYNST